MKNDFSALLGMTKSEKLLCFVPSGKLKDQKIFRQKFLKDDKNVANLISEKKVINLIS